MYIFKQVFRIRTIFGFLSSELYIKDKHSNGEREVPKESMEGVIFTWLIIL
jgi:hypothetical protein